MKDWINISAQNARKETPKEINRRETSISETAVSSLPLFNRDIILMLFVGVMAVFGLQTHSFWHERERIWRSHIYRWRGKPAHRAEQSQRDMIDDWAGGSPVHWRKQIRTKWLASRDINNSHDPIIRQAGFDAWFTRRAYSRDPGICFANIRQAALRLKAGNTLAAIDSMKVAAPP